MNVFWKSFWITIVVALSTIAAGYAHGHEVEADECSWYGQVAAMVASAKNGGASPTDLVPQLMILINSCSTNGKCPVKDGGDTKRVLDYVHQVYMLGNKEPIDVDAVEAKIVGECVNRAMSRVKPPVAPMVPDSSVPIDPTKPQIES